MSFSDVFGLAGGIALFLFGMTLMGDGLQSTSGNKLEPILYKLSGTPFKGLLLGSGVTGIIQSSSATSVIVMGFVNSGMMTLRQAMKMTKALVDRYRARANQEHAAPAPHDRDFAR